jgi:hypothetical protein
MTSRGDLRLMLTGLYPSKDPVPNFTEYRRYSQVLALPLQLHSRAWALTFVRTIRQGYDKTLRNSNNCILQDRVRMRPKAFVYESFGRPKNMKYKTSGRFPAKRSKLCY